ncbi:tyrosine-type recombinase/integrase [Methylobacterium oryzisoli]|uniref:tyrosine-type recombinase/integrase n=1 Tax=Methylobacterium oryzisoli TaxID=3385502 RepID=UPI0038913392
MALHYRKRGKVWHVRGKVRVGRQVFTLKERSTGCTLKAEAEAVGAAEEARIRAEALEGAVPRPRTISIGECIAAYCARPGGHHPFDEARLTELAAAMGATKLEEAPAAWGAWVRGRGRGLSPSTIARWRSSLKAALRYGADEFGVSAPSLRVVKEAESERIAYLTEALAARLLAAYNPWAAPVMLILCETGLRTQEALRLDWRCVDWARNVLLIEHAGAAGGARTKTKRSRRVGMRESVRCTLGALWEARGQPDAGPVFLNRWGRPYADTRRVGGNPLSKAHRTACRVAGVTSFRIHDWRHHFAVWFLKNGGNLRALCQIAGWSSMRMVQRYAVFEQSDLDDVMTRTAGTLNIRLVAGRHQNGPVPG